MRSIGPTLVLATHNRGKLQEIHTLLAPHGVQLLGAGDLDLPEPEETGASFAENALIKAHAAAKATNLPALADDSGLCVHALKGAPGIFSARWAGPAKDFQAAMLRIHHELGDAANRTAHFECVLALAWPDGHHEIIDGRVDGTIIWPPRGEHGFGYDPIFQPEGHNETFAGMEDEVKHAISHRGIAVQKLLSRISAENDA